MQLGFGLRNERKKRKEIGCPFVIEVRGNRINFTQPLCLPCSLLWFISSPTLYEKRQPATKRVQRAREAPEQREARLQKLREHSAARRVDETPEQQEKRLQKARKYSASRRGEDVKGLWQEYERKQKQQHRAQETTEQRESGLQIMRDYKDCPIMKEWNKNRMKETRANESAEQREALLQKMREYSASRRANKAERAKEAAVYPEIPQEVQRSGRRQGKGWLQSEPRGLISRFSMTERSQGNVWQS